MQSVALNLQLARCKNSRRDGECQEKAKVSSLSNYKTILSNDLLSREVKSFLRERWSPCRLLGTTNVLLSIALSMGSHASKENQEFLTLSVLCVCVAAVAAALIALIDRRPSKRYQKRGFYGFVELCGHIKSKTNIIINSGTIVRPIPAFSCYVPQKSDTEQRHRADTDEAFLFLFPSNCDC